MHFLEKHPHSHDPFLQFFKTFQNCMPALVTFVSKIDKFQKVLTFFSEIHWVSWLFFSYILHTKIPISHVLNRSKYVHKPIFFLRCSPHFLLKTQKKRDSELFFYMAMVLWKRFFTNKNSLLVCHFYQNILEIGFFRYFL